jgi:ArsR family metal-binding transcriptional regulator
MEIKDLLPCIADPSKYRVIGRIDVENLKEVAPYLARVLPNASYNAKEGWISFKKGQRIITIHGDGFVTMTMISDREEALSILKELEDKARLAWEKRNEIDISKPCRRPLLVFSMYTTIYPKQTARNAVSRPAWPLPLSF